MLLWEFCQDPRTALTAEVGGFKIAKWLTSEILKETRRQAMARMPKEVMALLNERPLVPKVLSTCDATGISSAKMYSRQEIRLD